MYCIFDGSFAFLVHILFNTNDKIEKNIKVLSSKNKDFLTIRALSLLQCTEHYSFLPPHLSSLTVALNVTHPLPAGGAVHSTWISSLATEGEASVTVLVQWSEKRVRTSPA